MTTQHPDLAAEQAYIDHAYACLERAAAGRVAAADLTEAGRGGTHQARYERDVFEEALSAGSPSSTCATPPWCSGASTG